MLHVTNGDSAGGSIAAAGLGGDVLPWRDILHDGPVPGGIADEELNAVRASFIADRGWAPEDAALADLAARNERLGRGTDEEIVLWFEHDLYDQLQLLQILAFLADSPDVASRTSLICIDRHPAVERFIGLGQLSSPQLAEVFPTRAAVTDAQLDLARRAWAAFRAPDPHGIEAIAAGDTSALPFLAAALRRHLQQFPATRSGLTRSEYQILEVVSARVTRLDRVFQATQDLEDAPYLGDTSLWGYMAELASGKSPLLRVLDGSPIGHPGSKADREREAELTASGRRVLRREADWIELRGGIDRWYGGVHLVGPRPEWRWDASDQRLVTGGN